MYRRFLVLLFLLAAFSQEVFPQAWSTFLDPSRATNWSSAGFTIPNYTTNCAIQPTLTTGSGAAAANTTAIQTALVSCDAAHNVVNLPAGTYYVAGWTYGAQGKQVVRGAGPNSTYINLTAEVGCAIPHGICMIDGAHGDTGSFRNLPPTGTTQCLWTAGYAQGTTSITLNTCPGGAPPVNQTLILDQANDTTDTGGVYQCDSTQSGCTAESGDTGGRVISGVTHSLQQMVKVTAVSGSGTGPFTVTITPGIYFNNIRSGQSPGAWWPGFVQNDGLENLSVDGTAIADGNIEIFDCYQCWVKNVRSIDAGRNHILIQQGAQDVIRDNYFFGSQGGGTQSYGIEFEIASGVLVENNIAQQVTSFVMSGVGTGNVVGYNFNINSSYAGSSFQPSYYGHGSGTQMGLWEGNNDLGIFTDAVHGNTETGTYFRNMLRGWQTGKTYDTFVIPLRSWQRVENVVGNVLGQPGIQNTYEAYATSSSSGVNAGTASTSIYELGWSDYGASLGICTSTGQPVVCDPLVRSTLMRWGNYDIVNNAVQWNSTEASPAAVTYANANFSSSYFGSLAHTLPASLYHSSTPSWWPSGKAWPPVGPDVTTGNVGTCSGTYAGAQATASSQCTGGTLSTAWASHVTSIPAQDCYLNTMGGSPDGSGGVLTFDASQCYGASGATTGTGPANPIGLTAVVQ